MEKQNNQDQKKPRLPEAIHPEIGNGALWESDPHFVNLRTIEPGSELDKLLFDSNGREEIIREWSSAFQNYPHSPDTDHESLGDVPDLKGDTLKSTDKPKGKEKKILASTRDKGQKPEWFEAMEDDLILREDPNKPEDLRIVEDAPPMEVPDTAEVPVPEGKRVRKAAKKVLKEQKIRKTERLNPPPRTEESSLSPFTRWLKGLRGSEYVHPYEDDYALEQKSGSNREGISETFADLLAAQGYKDQALDMYKLLMAKYPEKSSFFAAKIEALK